MKIVRMVRKVSNGVIVALFALLSLLVLMQVVCRIGHISQTWIDEISKFLFIWLVYLGGSVTVSRGLNITFDLFLDGAKGKTFTVLFGIVNFCCLTFLTAMMVLGAQNAWVNRGQSSAMTGINMGLMNLAIPVGCILMIGSQIEYYLKISKKRKEEELT